MPTCKLGPRTEDPSKWICPWCHAANYRQNAGADRCEECAAEVFTEFTGFENGIRVKFSTPPNE